MVGPILERDFYARDIVTLARDLLGRVLVRELPGQRLSGVIVETEAYGGADDAGSHAFRGATRRNRSMFGPPGQAYVFRIYGVHHCLNLVGEGDGRPGVVRSELRPLKAGEMERRRGRHGDGLTRSASCARPRRNLGLTVPTSAAVWTFGWRGERWPRPGQEVGRGGSAPMMPRVAVPGASPSRAMRCRRPRPWRPNRWSSSSPVGPLPLLRPYP